MCQKCRHSTEWPLRLTEEQHGLEAEFADLRRGTRQLRRQLQGALGDAARLDAAPDPPLGLGSDAAHTAEDELHEPMRLLGTSLLDPAGLPAASAERAGSAGHRDAAAQAGSAADDVHEGFLQEDMHLWHDITGAQDMQAVQDEVAGFSEDTRALLSQLDAIQI